MEIGTILGIVGSILGGGAAGAFITSYFNAKTEDKKTEIDASDRLVAQWEKLLSPLQSRVGELEKQLEISRQKESEYQNRINTLENQLILFESSHIDIPLPMWMKDTQGKMVFLNRMYEDMFLIPRGYSINDYVGKTDFEVWSEDVAKDFVANDKTVMRTKKHTRVIEKVNDGSGGAFYVDVLKYPRMTHGGKVIGLSGIIMNSSKTREKLVN